MWRSIRYWRDLRCGRCLSSKLKNSGLPLGKTSRRANLLKRRGHTIRLKSYSERHMATHTILKSFLNVTRVAKSKLARVPPHAWLAFGTFAFAFGLVVYLSLGPSVRATDGLAAPLLPNYITLWSQPYRGAFV